MASGAARASRCAPSPTPARRRSTAKPSSRSTDREKNMTRLAGKVALISGSGRGIGRALALKLARDGARIVVNDLDEEPAAAVVRTHKEFGDRKSGVEGKSGSVRVDHGGRRIHKKKKQDDKEHKLKDN